jgi:hypothetical protein
MSEEHIVRRHGDGSIDFDFYRTQATALRRQALRDSAVLRTACVGVMVGAIGFAVVLPAANAVARKQVAAWSNAHLIR